MCACRVKELHPLLVTITKTVFNVISIFVQSFPRTCSPKTMAKDLSQLKWEIMDTRIFCHVSLVVLYMSCLGVYEGGTRSILCALSYR